MTTKKRFAAYGMAATAAMGGGIGGLAVGVGLSSDPAELSTLPADLAAASPGEATPVHLGRGGPARVDRLAVAAGALGMPEEELRTALQGGKSIAQVATDRNLDVQKVIDALVAAQTAALDKAVADGALTQARADERKAGLAARVKADVERTGLRGRGGPGKHGPGGGALRVDHLGVTAQALGMPVEELRTALQGGKSIAQVAGERNVEVQKVIDALVAAKSAALDKAVADGALTQAQAEERKAGLFAHVGAEVERTGLGGRGGPGGGRGGRGGAGHVDRLAVASLALGMSAADLRTALEGGRSIAQVAADRNVEVQKVIDALVAAENAELDRAVAAGRLTQAQADEKKAGVAARVKAGLERAGLRGPGSHGGPGRPGRGPGARPAGTTATPSTVVVS